MQDFKYKNLFDSLLKGYEGLMEVVEAMESELNKNGPVDPRLQIAIKEAQFIYELCQSIKEDRQRLENWKNPFDVN